MRRVLCVYFPDWAAQRRLPPERRGEEPLAILRPDATRGSRVVGCDAVARQRGVRLGMTKTEACALVPGLRTEFEDVDGDRETLERWAEWAKRFGPVVGLEQAVTPQCLYVDVAPGAACFGGEVALARRACAEFADAGWTVHIALADRLGAAWAIAHAREAFDDPEVEQGTISSNWFAAVAPGEDERRLGRLPVAALRLEPETLDLLGKLGVERIATLAALPRSEVAQRFGPDALRRLDFALHRSEAIEPCHAAPDVEASWAFEFPLERREAIVSALEQLLPRLEAALERRGEGLRAFECLLYPACGPAIRVEGHLSRPVRESTYLGKMLRSRFDAIRIGAPIAGVRIRATAIEPLRAEPAGLFDGDDPDDEAEFARLLDSVAAQFGKEAVTVARFVDDPQPELAYRLTSALGGAPTPEEATPRREHAHRPIELYARPRPVSVAESPEGEPLLFRHDDVDHVIVRATGPERIETGWWRDADVARDYFAVDAADGTRWWLFRRRADGHWFLHGAFD